MGLGWFLCGILGGIPFFLSEPGLSWHASLFESISGFTTTGATGIQDLTLWPISILFWRSITQWLGGLGILVLFVALLSQLGVGNRSVFMHESSLRLGGRNIARAKDIARGFLQIYLLLSLLCVGGLKVLGMSWFEALNHGMTTISTGGFSLYNESIAYFSDLKFFPFIEVWLIFFMFLSSLNFSFYVALSTKSWSKIPLKEETFLYVLWLISISFCVLLGLSASLNWDLARGVFFTVVSISSTTGFSTGIDYNSWGLYMLILLGFCMLFGGCAGSTSGGLKWNRFVIFVKIIADEMVHIFRPDKISSIRVNGASLRRDATYQVTFFILLYLFVLLFSVLIVSFLEMGSGVDFATALGIVLSTVSNIGPGFGEVGPANNFSWLNPRTQIFCCLLMIFGRLELYAGILIFLPFFWKRY